MVNSRNKGKRGELEAARFLSKRGWGARRGQQYSGGPDSADLVHDVPGIHFEVKRTERLRLYEALEQSCKDAPASAIPAVLTRKNGEEWVVVLSAHNFLELMREIVELRGRG